MNHTHTKGPRNHPTVIRLLDQAPATETAALEAAWPRRIALEAGADDVGFVGIGRPEIDPQPDAGRSGRTRRPARFPAHCRLSGVFPLDFPLAKSREKAL